MAFKIVVPSLGESIIEATVANWLKKEGDPVSTGEPIVELETEKVNLDVGAERNGTLTKIERKAGEDVKVGDVLGVIEEMIGDRSVEKTVPPEKPAQKPSSDQNGAKSQAPTSPPPAEKKPEVPQVNPPGQGEAERVSPIARRVAQEHGINPSEVPPSRPGGRITRQDVEGFLTQKAFTQESPPPARLIMRGQPEREERVLMTRRRRTIAQHLLEATQSTAMLTTFNEVDMSAIMQLRKRRKDEFKEKFGVSLGIVSFFIKATVIALREFPMLNAEIQGEEVIYKHYFDIGVAVGATEGLVVPVLREVDRMSFPEIERTLQNYVAKTQDGTLGLEDLRGGTFTITNGGVFGSLLSTPILNPPQVGILGLHKIEDRPIAVDGQVVIRPMMYVALSYDHRLVDGREAVQFLVRVKQIIEYPEIMMLES